jgi:hypothetical protein
MPKTSKKQTPKAPENVTSPEKNEKPGKPYKRYAIMVVITWLLLELLAPVVYNLQSPKSFSRGQIKEALANRTRDGFVIGKDGPNYAGIHVLHPYLGFAKNKEVRRNANSYGLIGESPLLKKAPNTINVAITGGSVALQFFEQQKEYFKKKLAQSAKYRGQKINFVSLALEGYKQPQQLIALSYMLFLGAEYDIVINFDGFNDLVLPIEENLRSKVNPFFPRGWQLYATKGMNPRSALQLGKINQIKLNQIERASLFQNFPLNFSNFTLSLWQMLDQQDENEIRLEYIKLTQMNQNQHKEGHFQSTGPETNYADAEAVYSDVVSRWQGASRQMQALCKAYDIDYYHFLQPNQYLEGSKPLSDKEKQTAVMTGDKNARHPDFLKGQLVNRVYTQMINAGLSLQQNHQIMFADLTRIFEDKKQTLYKDFCCHINSEGNKIIADRMIALLNNASN